MVDSFHCLRYNINTGQLTVDMFADVFATIGVNFQIKGDAMPIKTRRLERRDEARWRELFAGYVAFYEAEVPNDVVALTFARLLEGGEQIGLVAVDDGDQPIGLAHILFHRSTWSATGYCYLEDLFVDPAVRGSGAGRALIEAAAREAEGRAATRLYWVTQEHNETARSLYDKVATLAPFVQYRR